MVGSSWVRRPEQLLCLSTHGRPICVTNRRPSQVCYVFHLGEVWRPRSHRTCWSTRPEGEVSQHNGPPSPLSVSLSSTLSFALCFLWDLLNRLIITGILSYISSVTVSSSARCAVSREITKLLLPLIVVFSAQSEIRGKNYTLNRCVKGGRLTVHVNVPHLQLYIFSFLNQHHSLIVPESSYFPLGPAHHWQLDFYWNQVTCFQQLKSQHCF